MKPVLIFTYFCMVSQMFYAQVFEVSLELKPRFEYRHGFKTLFPDDVEAAKFVSQRSRLNFKFESEKLKAYISLQNVRVWGDVNTLSENDINGTAVHEAWASLPLNSNFSLKMGRQEIVYDDSRIFGNVDWAQSGRSHDAFIATFQPKEHNRLDLGFALNQEDETLFEMDYNLNNYKAFQYAWYHTSFKDITISLLALNTGFSFEKEDEEQDVAYNQIFGTHATYGKQKLKADASFYFQTGKIVTVDWNAVNLAGNLHYDITTNFNVGFGAEYLSGTDMNANETTIRSFNPLFGTNHKFNGWMDYFYVGNHINSVGLLDLNLPLKYHKEKLTIQVVPHLFSAAATVLDMNGNIMDSKLGTEIDLAFIYKVADNIQFEAGYSHLFATETMEVLKGGNKDNTNNWAWAMFIFKPKLFTHHH